MKSQDQKNKLLEEIAKIGIIEVACMRSGVSRSTYYKWIRSNSKFKQKAIEAINAGLDKINDSAVSVIVKGISNDDFKSATYWLSRRHPAFKTLSKTKRRVKRRDKDKVTGFDVIIHDPTKKDWDKIKPK